MVLKRFEGVMLVLVLGGVCLIPAASFGARPAVGSGFGQRGGWDAPPGGLNDVQRRGFQDGIEGARKDYGNHRQPDVNNRDEYRHPDVPRGLRDEYRDGFRRGYNVAKSHLMGGGPGMGGPGMMGGGPMMRDRDHDRWDMVPGGFGAIQRQGFLDGLEGARKDFGNHRQPDVNNRDEYRHPHLPPGERQAYQDGFRRGYDRGVAHYYGMPARY